MAQAFATGGGVAMATVARMAMTALVVLGAGAMSSARTGDSGTPAAERDGARGTRVGMSLVATGAGGTAPVIAANMRQPFEGSKDSAPPHTALVGSWVETVTFAPDTGRPPLKSLGTYHADQTMTCSDQGNVTIEPPTVFSACHGAWTYLDKRTFAYTSVELMSDLSGNLVGYLKVRGVYTVAPSGDEYHGTSFAEVVDPDGIVLYSVSVTNDGRRIRVELP